MSTLKTINIIHPSGSTNNIVNDASGNITVGNNITVTGTLTGSTSVMNIGSGQLYKDASGNVGIGTSSPGQNLEVYSSNAFLAGITRATTSTDAGAIFSFSTLNASSAKTSMADILGAASTTTAGSEAGYISFRTKTSGSMTEKARIDASGNFQFNSGYGSVATAYGCRAWVNFNGNSGTIRASGNVSSVTRNSTGIYTINLTTAMPDTNYIVVSVPDDSGTINPTVATGYLGSTRTASAYQLETIVRGASSASLYDPSIVNVTIFR